jgi:hypothetical protein
LALGKQSDNRIRLRLPRGEQMRVVYHGAWRRAFEVRIKDREVWIRYGSGAGDIWQPVPKGLSGNPGMEIWREPRRSFSPDASGPSKHWEPALGAAHGLPGSVSPVSALFE